MMDSATEESTETSIRDLSSDGASQGSGADAIEAVRVLLTAVGISRVMVVDDEFELKIEDLYEAGVSVKNQTISVAEIGDVDFSSEPELWRGKLSDSWETLGPVEKRSALEDLCKKSSTPLPISEELHLFYDLKPEIDFQGMTPDEWKSTKDSVIGAGANSPMLVLFDRDLGSGKSNEGHRLAVDLYDADHGGHIWAGLLTNTVEVADEGSVWKEFTDENADYADRFILLSKKHLVDDANSFPEALRVVLISQPASTLSNQVQAAITSSAEKVALEIKRLSPPEFERIVFGLARDEGVWEVDVLLRLFDARLRSNVRDALHEDHAVRRSTRLLRKLSEPRGTNNPVSVEAQHIYRDELYERPEHLNRFHLPVELGDFFQKTTGQEKQFVLVGQPCDLMVRTDGKRTPDLSFVTLLPICSDDPNKAKPDSKTHRAVFELPAFKGGDPAWVEMDRPCLVPVESVDYCVLNDDGSGLAPIPGAPPDWIVPNWERRWDRLARKAETLRRALEGSNNDERITQVKAQFGIRPDCKAKPSLEGDNFTLGLTRTGRILSPYARALLTNYSAHLARDAFEPAIA